MHGTTNDTHSVLIFVQFPIRSGIFPDSTLPSILLQLVEEVLDLLKFKTNKCQNNYHLQICQVLQFAECVWNCSSKIVGRKKAAENYPL